MVPIVHWAVAVHSTGLARLEIRPLAAVDLATAWAGHFDIGAERFGIEAARFDIEAELADMEEHFAAPEGACVLVRL